MRTLYTQLFSDFLADNATTPEWTAIVTKFSSFPAFYIDGVRKSDGTYTSVNIDNKLVEAIINGDNELLEELKITYATQLVNRQAWRNEINELEG